MHPDEDFLRYTHASVFSWYQDSPIGLLTRVAPAIQLDKTPAYVERAGSFPGSSTLDIGWGPDLLAPHAVPHRPTSIFRLGLAHFRGTQVL